MISKQGSTQSMLERTMHLTLKLLLVQYQTSTNISEKTVCMAIYAKNIIKVC